MTMRDGPVAASNSSPTDRMISSSVPCSWLPPNSDITWSPNSRKPANTTSENRKPAQAQSAVIACALRISPAW